MEGKFEQAGEMQPAERNEGPPQLLRWPDGPAAVFAAALETAVRACMAPPGGGKLFFADLTKFPAVFSLSCAKRGMCQNFCCIAPAKVV